MSLKLLENGRIYSSFRPLVIVEAIIIDNGKIEYAGYRDKAIEKLAGREHERINLHGKTVIPGFVDAHMHLDELGKSINSIDMRGATSIEEMKERIRNAPKNGWIIGHGWDQEIFAEGRWPERKDIDSVTGDLPAYLSRLDLHSAVLNTKAMEMLGLLDGMESPDIMKDSNGNPNGVVKESIFSLAKSRIDETLPDSQIEKFIADGLELASRLGLTSLGFVSCSYRALKILDKIRTDGGLKIRVFVYINPQDIDQVAGFRNDDYLAVRGVKIFSDGSLGSRTALMSEPYTDDSSTSGKAAIEEEDLIQLCRKAEDLNLDIATHAIGDEALDLVLDVYSELERRHRIEHVSIIREDQIARLVQTGTTAVVQPHFVITDFWVLDRIGKERAQMFHPFNTMLKSGVTLAFSTDCPVEKLNPLETLYAAVTRGRNEKVPVYEHSREEEIGIADAMDAYTARASAALGNPDSGTLTTGSPADFLILSRNPLFEREARIPRIEVLKSYVNGEVIYSSEQVE